MTRKYSARALLLICVMLALLLGSTRLNAQTGCSQNPTPFTDLGNMPSAFCPAVTVAYFSGIANGTTATTYSPALNVTRDQMAAFVTRTLDQSLKRGSQRAALNIRWNVGTRLAMGDTQFPTGIHRVQADGADLWVSADLTLQRVRASDGKILEEFTGITSGGRGVLVVGKQVYVVGRSPGKLYIVLRQGNPGNVAVEFPTNPALPNFQDGIAFDGMRIWIGSQTGAITLLSFTGDASIVTGFNQPRNLIYDGTNMWASDFGSTNLFKLDANGAILQTVTVGSGPLTMAFDGTNIWVPNYFSNSVSVVRAVGVLSGTVLATLTGNGLDHPSAVAFDGERMLVTNEDAESISLFRAADLAPLLTLPLNIKPVGACSDGINFWITSIPTAVGNSILWRY